MNSRENDYKNTHAKIAEKYYEILRQRNHISKIPLTIQVLYTKEQRTI